MAYLISRAELLAAIGVLTACLAATWASPWKYPVMVLAVLFGLAGKQSAIVAVGLIPLTLWAKDKR